MLLGEDGGRAEDEGLTAVQRDGERGAHGNLGLAEADVAAHETIHRPPRLEILFHGLDRLELILGLAIGERALEPLEPVVREVERLAGGVPAAGVQGEELASELAHRGARAALEVLPRLPAELGQRRRLRVGPDVPGDLPDLLVRNVEAVVASEGEEEVVARDAGDLPRLEAEELADSVVLVDDVVAYPKVGERLERAPEPLVHPGWPLAEDLRVREEGYPEVSPDEAASRGAHDERDGRIGGELADVVGDVRLDLPQHALCAQCLALMREGDDDAPSLPHHSGELVLGLGEAARGDRRALGLEDVRLRSRQRIQSCRPVEARRLESLLLPETRDVVDLPHQVGTGLEERNPLGLVAIQSAADDALARRVDRRVGHRMQRTLRERRERSDLLDVVPEKLDAQGLASGAREDVDEAATNRDLASLLDAFRALVPGERQLLDECVEVARAGASQSNDRGPFLGRRHALGERACRHAHEPSVAQDVEGACPFADQVCGGIEARVDAHAAARQERNRGGVDEPADSLGDVACVLVLGEHADECAVERRAQRPEEERQHGLGHTCIRRERVDERGKALARSELVDEPSEW